MAAMQHIKCVVVGDGSVGKTSLLITHSCGAFPADFVPTVCDNYSQDVPSAEPPYRLSLWDTGGASDYDKLRPITYADSNVFLLCFSVASKQSFEHITAVWGPELRRHEPSVPVILVGLKADLRGATTTPPTQPVTPAAATAVAKSLGAVCYLECSALTQAGLKAVFDETARIGLDHAQGGKAEQQKMKKGCTIL